MGTIEDKLNYLVTAKTAIKNSIASKGIPITDSDSLATYSSKINSINSTNFGNALPADVINGKTFVNANGKQTGSMPSNPIPVIGDASLKKTYPAGYYPQFTLDGWEVLKPISVTGEGGTAATYKYELYHNNQAVQVRLVRRTSTSDTTYTYNNTHENTLSFAGVYTTQNYTQGTYAKGFVSDGMNISWIDRYRKSDNLNHELINQTAGFPTYTNTWLTTDTTDLRAVFKLTITQNESVGNSHEIYYRIGYGIGTTTGAYAW